MHKNRKAAVIRNIQNNLSRIEKVPYINYGAMGYYRKNQNEDESSSDKDNKDTFESNLLKNPFEQNKLNNHQQNFNENYNDINDFVKKAKSDLQPKGRIKSKVDDAIIDKSVAVFRYLYDDNSTPDNCGVDNIKGGAKILKTYDKENKTMPLSEVEFKGGNILKINLYEDGFDYTVILWNRNFIDRFLKTDGVIPKKYQKFDKEGNLIEQTDYSKNAKPERYIQKDGNMTQEILFDLNTYSAKSELQPRQYNLYINDNKIKSLKYEFSIPSKYEEYDETTSKLTKVFQLQGLKSNVYKYAFYNSLSGNLIASGAV